MERIRIPKGRSRRRQHDAAQVDLRVEADQAPRRRVSLARQLDEALLDIDLVLERSNRREV